MELIASQRTGEVSISDNFQRPLLGLVIMTEALLAKTDLTELTRSFTKITRDFWLIKGVLEFRQVFLPVSKVRPTSLILFKRIIC